MLFALEEVPAEIKYWQKAQMLGESTLGFFLKEEFQWLGNRPVRCIRTGTKFPGYSAWSLERRVWSEYGREFPWKLPLLCHKMAAGGYRRHLAKTAIRKNILSFRGIFAIMIVSEVLRRNLHVQGTRRGVHVAKCQ